MKMSPSSPVLSSVERRGEGGRGQTGFRIRNLNQPKKKKVSKEKSTAINARMEEAKVIEQNVNETRGLYVPVAVRGSSEARKSDRDNLGRL